MFLNRRCKITYVAHGETIYTAEDRLCDTENHPPLNDAGCDEMENLCKYFKERGIASDKIYCSSAQRTIQSAKIISKVYGKKNIEIVDELKPLKLGALNGLTLSQIEEKYPKLIINTYNSPYENLLDGLEPVGKYIEHISKTIYKIVEENNGNRIIIVTHPEVISAAVCDALGTTPSSFFNIFIKTGSATQISYFEDIKSLIYCDYKPL